MKLWNVILRIWEIIKGREELYSKVCTVISVDLAKRTCVCQPIDDSAELTDVRLQASESLAEGWFLEPDVNSFVIVSYMNPKTAFVTYFSTIKNAYMKADYFQFNDGKLDGLINIKTLTEKLNVLVKEINTETAKIKIAITGLGGAYAQSSCTVFKQSHYEDLKVKH